MNGPYRNGGIKSYYVQTSLLIEELGDWYDVGPVVSHFKTSQIDVYVASFCS